MELRFWVLLLLLFIGAIASVKTKKLTPMAAVAGWLCAVLVFAGAGYTGIAMMSAFFLLATVATSAGFNRKKQLGLDENEKGRRGASQVIANAGAAAILGIVAWLFPTTSVVIPLMIAACFAAATADTISSEIGNAYGRKFINILTLKADTRGLDGVISAEGTIAGLFGSAFIALIYFAGFGESASFLIILISGTIGNLSDSVLGATLERKSYLNNDLVNFLNTLIAAMVCWLLYCLFA